MRYGAQHGELLDRLVRRPIFTQRDGIMREYKDGVRHASARPDECAGLAVVAEAEESRSVRNQAAVNRHAIDRRAHAELTHPEEDIAARRIEMEVATVLSKWSWSRWSRSAAPPISSGTALRDGIHDFAARAAGSDRLRIRREDRQALFPAAGQLA